MDIRAYSKLPPEIRVKSMTLFDILPGPAKNPFATEVLLGVSPPGGLAQHPP